MIDGSYFHDAVVGHEVKSRALATTIQNSRIQDQNGTASYSIDLPNGGNALIYNNTIEQGPNSDNPIIIDFGEEGGVYSGSALQVTNNLVLNHLGSSSARAINNTVSSVTAQITGNRFFGLTQSQVANGANSQSGNQFLTSEPALVTTHPWLDSSVTTNATVAVSDTTTGQAVAATPSPYSGPVAGLVQQYIYTRRRQCQYNGNRRQLVLARRTRGRRNCRDRRHQCAGWRNRIELSHRRNRKQYILCR